MIIEAWTLFGDQNSFSMKHTPPLDGDQIFLITKKGKGGGGGVIFFVKPLLRTF